METKTFKTIFTAGNNSTGKNVEIKKIEIPKIQRDYAYGRTDKKNERKRKAYRSFCRLKKSKCVSMGHFAGW